MSHTSGHIRCCIQCHLLASRCDHFYLQDPFIITLHDTHQFARFLPQNCVSSAVSKNGSELERRICTFGRNKMYSGRSMYQPGKVMMAAISPGRMRGEGRKPSPTLENWKSQLPWGKSAVQWLICRGWEMKQKLNIQNMIREGVKK